MDETKKATIERLKSLGNVKGSCTNGIFTYLEFLGHKDKFPQILARTGEYGAPLESPKVNPFELYPIAQEMALLFAIQDTLGWSDEELKELGRNIPRVSPLVKLFLKYFLTLMTSTKEAEKYWSRHYDFAELEVVNTDIDSGNYIVEVRGFDIHPTYNVFLSGFLETMIGFVASNPLSSEVARNSTDGDGINRFRFFYKS